MSEEPRAPHPQEPAEGSEENIEAPGAEKAKETNTLGKPTDPDTEENSSKHPQEPAEGGDDKEGPPGADKPSNAD